MSTRLTSTIGFAGAALMGLTGSNLPAADPNKPAHFEITNIQEQPDPGPFTATIGSIPGAMHRIWKNGSFEPFTYRTKRKQEGDAANEVILSPNDGHTFGTFQTGFWDGARVRAYRIVNGEFTKVRDSQVPEGGYIAEGAHPLWETRGDDVLPPGTRQVTLKVHSRRYVPGTYWFGVRTVVGDGAMSQPAWTKVDLSGVPEDRGRSRVKTIDVEGPREEQVDTSLPSPSRVSAQLNASELTLTWTAPDGVEVAGWDLAVTAVDPATHRGFVMKLEPAKEGDQALEKGDLLFITHEHMTLLPKSFYHGWRQPRLRWAYGVSPDERDDMQWRHVAHTEASRNAVEEPGRSYLEVDLQADDPFTFGTYSHGPEDGDWYEVLDPESTYRAESWVKFDGEGSGTVSFNDTYFEDETRTLEQQIQPGEWTKVVFDWSPSKVYQGGGTAFSKFVFEGRGKWSIDNARFYDKGIGYLQPSDLTVQRLQEFGLSHLRYHNHIKTDWSHSMKDLLNPPGVISFRGERSNNLFTLPRLLEFTRDGGTDPWLQVEMHMTENEWLGLVEYLCAPFDPAKDSQQTKPWAAMRHAQGQTEPWIDVFDSIYFEISNETWNGLFHPWTFNAFGTDMHDAATGTAYSGGAVYGMWQEYVINLLRTSPYWSDEVEDKFTYILGGWANQSGPGGYGAQAIVHSPSSDYVTIAGYNGGWDEGEGPAKTDPKSLLKAITFWPRREQDGRTRTHINTMETLISRGLTDEYGFGTYEAGPGYALSGLNGQEDMTAEEMRAQDENGKSLASGVSTLDAFLGRAVSGFGVQNFFTFQFHPRTWTSHSFAHFGAISYPTTQALSLYNHVGTGDFLNIVTHRVPTADISVTERRRDEPTVYKDLPMTAAYATRKDDRVTVFVLSRKIPGVIEGDNPDGYTSVGLELPFESAERVLMYKMTGKARDHNLESEEVTIEGPFDVPFAQRFVLTPETTGMETYGMPPNSVFCYVFEGVDLPPVNRRPRPSFEVPEVVALGKPVSFRNTSTDPDGQQMRYAWDFAGFGTSNETNPTFTFDQPGVHRVVLKAQDTDQAVGDGFGFVKVVPDLPGDWDFSNEHFEEQFVDIPATLKTEGDAITITQANGKGWGNCAWMYLQDPRFSRGKTITVKLESLDSDAMAGIFAANDPVAKTDRSSNPHRFVAWAKERSNLESRVGWYRWGRLSESDKKVDAPGAQWLRLTWQSDDNLSFEYSVNGQDWEEHGNWPIHDDVDELYPGIFVSGGTEGSPVTATFSDFQMRDSTRQAAR
ncbi:MAG: PKD domain-containing protein [Opitutales bacterium]